MHTYTITIKDNSIPRGNTYNCEIQAIDENTAIRTAKQQYAELLDTDADMIEVIFIQNTYNKNI